MSSIMDELRRLQGKRTPGRPSSSPDPSDVPDASEPLDAQLADAPGAPVLTHRAAAGHPGEHTRLLLGGLIAALALAAALSIAVLGGWPREESAPVAMASRQDAPQETTEPADVADPAPDVHAATEPPGPDVAADNEPVAADQPVEVAEAVEPSQEADAAKMDLVVARLHVLEAIEPLHEPPGGESHDAEPATPPDQQLAEVASPGSGDAPAAPAPEPAAEASPEAVERAVPEPVEEPVRILTKAEDEANKTAIRSLKVFGVLADDRGIGVYTSEGQLRKGDRFNGMAITEVTSRYVLFECGNKRYRWMLPRRHARADRDAS